MSIASENNRIESARDTIRQKMVSAGLANGNETIDELASLLRFDSGSVTNLPIVTPLFVITSSSHTFAGVAVNYGNYCIASLFYKASATLSLFPKAKEGTVIYSQKYQISNNAISGYKTSPYKNEWDYGNAISLSEIYDKIIYVPDVEHTDDIVFSGSGYECIVKPNGMALFTLNSDHSFDVTKTQNSQTLRIKSINCGTALGLYGKGSTPIRLESQDGRRIEAVFTPELTTANYVNFDIINDSGDTTGFTGYMTLLEPYTETLRFLGG